MTYLARYAGPASSQDEVGRDLIVRRTRAAMQDRPRSDLSRQEIAKTAGVTPALISYYFPDRSNLFEAIAVPIIEDFRHDVQRIIHANQSLNEKLRGLIGVYLAFHYREGFLVDFYVGSLTRSGSLTGLKRLIDVRSAAVAFVGEMLDGRCILGECPDEVQSTLWGMCKQVARRSANRGSAGSAVTARIAAETDLIYDFFMNGVAIVLPTDPMLHASQA